MPSTVPWTLFVSSDAAVASATSDFDVLMLVPVTVVPATVTSVVGKWIVNSSGPGCRGTKETWAIDDVTGEIEYLGVQ